VRGGTRRLLESEICHLRDRSDNGEVGISRLTRAAGVVGQAQAVAEFTGSMWRNGTHPGGALQTDQVLNDQSRSNLAERLKQFHTGPRNAARILLPEAGLKWQTLNAAPGCTTPLPPEAYG
jgi:phage portal protein BeeE